MLTLRSKTRTIVAVLSLATALAGCRGQVSDPPTEPRAQAAASSSTTPSLKPTPEAPALHMVVIGDSIPVNSPQDCPGCTGFVDRFATVLEQAYGKELEVANHSQHNGLTIEMLLDELDLFTEELSAADVIVIGIAHNSIELASYTPCGSPVDDNELPDWTVMTKRCAEKGARKYRQLYDELFETVAGLRTSKPTLLRTLNRYNDWIGWPEGHFTPRIERKTAMFIRIWNRMLCASAEAHGFGCADLSTAFNGRRGLRPSGDLVAADYTHPSELGNKVIANVLASLGTGLTPVG